MPKPKRRRSDRALRARMRSPCRPPVARREERQRFWAAIAKGSALRSLPILCRARGDRAAACYQQRRTRNCQTPASLASDDLARIATELPFILVSRDTSLEEACAQSAPSACLKKPFEIDALLAAVHDLVP